MNNLNVAKIQLNGNPYEINDGFVSGIHLYLSLINLTKL